MPIRIERRAFPSLSIPVTRERCERRARLETLTPRDNTDLALVNSGYSKTKLRRGCSGVSLSEFFPHQTDMPVPIGDSRRPNGTASTPHHGISRRHRIGKYRQTENIRQFFVTARHTAEIFLANLPSHPDPKTGPLIQTSRLSPVLRLFYTCSIFRSSDDGLQSQRWRRFAAAAADGPLGMVLTDGHFSRRPLWSPAFNMGKKWLPLESNPEVMADFAHA